MDVRAPMTPEQSFFAVFCIEQLADELNTKGNKIYDILTGKSDILDSYIIPCYDSLHTQGRDWIIDDLITFMKERELIE